MNEASTIVAEEKSTHKVETFVLGEFTKHPNADSLSLIKIGDTDYSYVGKTVDWECRVGQGVAWIPPDSLVDTTRPEFAFLMADAKYDQDSKPTVGGQYARIKAKKLRGVVSYGLMVLYDGIIGEDAAEALGVKHYEPPLDGKGGAAMGGDVDSAPTGCFPKYDVDAFLKYGRHVFQEGEACFVTEKIHGANARYVYACKSGEAVGSMNCGSRTEWKKEFSAPPNITLEELKARIGDDVKAQEVFDRAVNNYKPKKNLWWVALESAPQLRAYCEANPGYAVYGEVYGQVQKGYSYGVPPGEVRFAAFDILRPNGSWMGATEFLATCKAWSIPHVPVLQEAMPFDFEKLVELATGNTLMNGASHIREGVVVKPLLERWDKRLGRVNLKIVNPAYLEK